MQIRWPALSPPLHPLAAKNSLQKASKTTIPFWQFRELSLISIIAMNGPYYFSIFLCSSNVTMRGFYGICGMTGWYGVRH
jgi:hypothetical protein